MYSSLVEKFCYPIEFKEKNDEWSFEYLTT
jgi:hypothetical protein